MTQFEFYKSIQFVAELFLAETIFTYKLRKNRFFWLKLPLGLIALFLFSYMLPIFSTNAFYIFFLFLAIFIFSIFVCKLLYKVTWLTMIFCCLGGYTVQHIAYELWTFFFGLSGLSAGMPMGFYGDEFVGVFTNPVATAYYLAAYAITYFLCSLCFGEKLDGMERIELNKFFMFFFAIFMLVVDILLNAFVVSHAAEERNVFYQSTLSIYNILCCVFALYLQIESALNKQLETTLLEVGRMWEQAKKQYAISKENIEALNIKYHDLKHQIRNFGEQKIISQSVASELYERIAQYDSAIKSGNAALDVILTEKSLICNKYGIIFSCIADGEKLDFMPEADVYALFGNIMDNAIEAVKNIDSSKRVISLKVKQVNDFVVVDETNYFSGKLKFVNGLPQTTKQNKEMHGFGMKSIEVISGAYDGNLKVSQEDELFHLNILFIGVEQKREALKKNPIKEDD